MLQPSYVVIGIAREQVSGSEYGWYWGTTFGNVDDSGGPPPPTATPTTVPPAATSTPSPSPTATATPVGASPPPPPTATPTTIVPPTATPTAVPNIGGPDPVLDLDPGANLATWPGDDTAPSAALNDANGPIVTVYGHDPVRERWYRFGPNLPGYVNNLTMLRYGGPYWFITLGSVALPITK